MRITIHDSLTHEGDVDLEVAPGTPLHEIVEAFSPGPPWCGAQVLDSLHAAGTWPLVAGAILTAHAGRPCVAPGTVHLATISGPDAGVMIPIDCATTIGGVGGIGLANPPMVVSDDAIDTHHVTVSPTPTGTLQVKDNRSVNGTGVWRASGDGHAWRGRRRTTTVRIGDVIAIGHSLLEVRRGLAQDTVIGAISEGEPTLTPEHPATPARGVIARWRTLWSHPLRFIQWISRRFPHRTLSPRDALFPTSALPDPTRADGWDGPIVIGGAHSIALARAVILARGRRPPPPMPLDEPWLQWLPPALVGDGAIRLRLGPPTACASAVTVLVAEDDRTSSQVDAVSVVGPVVRVSAQTADSLARLRASHVRDPHPGTVHWAEAALLERAPLEAASSRNIVTGVRVDDPLVPWEIALGPSSPLTIVTGAPGSGKTTLLATMAGALALELPQEELCLAILCGESPGALAQYDGLPQVRAMASHVKAGEALRIVDSLDFRATLTVIMVDDIDALGPDGRAVSSRLESLTMGELRGRVHVVLATQRPTAVLTPSLRASTATGIALRTTCESDSVEVTGIATATRIPIEAPGMALVRSSGRIDEVRVALPYAEAPPRVRRCDTPLVGAKTLADAARDVTAPTCRQDRARAGPALPAS